MPTAKHVPRWIGAGALSLASTLSTLTLASGCAPRLVPLHAGGEAPPLAGQALEVIPATAGAPDPLPVRGAWVAYEGLSAAAAHAVAAAAAPWAARHAAERAGGWQMLLEIVRADADARDGRLTVEIEARVTLRGTAGQIHIGQTRGYCKQTDDGGDGVSDDGSLVVYRCLERMSRDLAGWLEGLNP